MLVQILIIEQHITFSLYGFVTTRPSRLLDVILEGVRYLIVYDHSNIPFVHSHAKCRSSHHYAHFTIHERILVFNLLSPVHLSVVRPCLETVLSQPSCQFIGFPRP